MGNIIGENIDLNVRQQVEIRQNSLSSPIKTSEDLQYQNKTSWLRLASSVDLDYKREPKVDEEGKIATEKLEKKFKESIGGDVSGNALARRFVLFNTLSQYNEDGSVNLRGGFNPNLLNQSSYIKSQDGYVPNSGLEGAQITFYNRGSLSKAIIQIKCFSPEQLDILEFLYMRVGYTILLEWGHTSYFSNFQTKETFTNFNTEPLQKLFNNNSEFYEILDAIKNTREKHSYNYDGFYGKITNFNWSYNNDGTYSITLTAISLGDIIESLNINKDFNLDNFPKFKLDEDSDAKKSDPSKNKEKNFLFNILNKYQKNLDRTGKEKNNTKSKSFDVYYGRVGEERKFTQKRNGIEIENSKSFSRKVRYSKALLRVDFKSKVKSKKGGKDIIVESTNSKYYIKLGYFLKDIQKYFLLYSKEGSTPIFHINFENKTNYCLTYPEQISADPDVCLIPQSSTGYLEKQVGTNFKIENNEYIGRLMDIHINMEYILAQFNSIMSSGEDNKVPLYQFLQQILNGVSNALGNINKFEITFDNDENELIIREDNNLAYKDLIGKGITKFNVKQLGSIVKNVNFNVQISSAFATMVSVGAQANGNIVGEDATSLSKMYKGSIDRTYKEKLDKETKETDKTKTTKDQEEARKKEEKELKNKLEKITKKFYNDLQPNPSTINDFINLNTTYSNMRVGSLANGNIIPPQGFLPFDLQVQLEGISGIKIYQKFNITDRILPSTYRDDNGKSKINFVIKGITHEIKGNIWDTTLQSLTIPAEPNPYKTLPPTNVEETTTTETIPEGTPETGDRAEKIVKAIDFLVGKGATVEGAAGLVGNLIAESNLKLSNLERPQKAVPSDQKYTNNQGGNGIAQWTGIRRTQWEKAIIGDLRYTIKNRTEYEKAIRDKGLDAQLEFLWNELSNSYKPSYESITTSSDTSKTAVKVVQDFERPLSWLSYNLPNKFQPSLSKSKKLTNWELEKNRRKKLAADALATYRKNKGKTS